MRTADQIYAQLCGSTTDNLTDEERNDSKLMSQLDDLMFMCAGCGWWCCVSELSSNEEDADLMCIECEPDEEDHL